jgi:hypothetical protein
MAAAAVFLAASPLQSIAQAGTPVPAQSGASSQPGVDDGQAPQSAATPNPQTGTISGTAVDLNSDLIPGATVVVNGPAPADRRTAVATDNGDFAFSGLKPGVAYHVTIAAKGFVDWTSPAVVLTPGQYLFLTGAALEVQGGVTSVTVSASPAQIATEEVRLEEQQRVFGLIPNFYVAYGPNPAPLTAKLKFKIASKVTTDPITLVGVVFFAGINQAAHTPDYGEGATGYGERVGAAAADGFTDIMFGGAVLPALLRQDPRYFYKGSGTKKSRLARALYSPFVCKGDNGRWQPNYSTVGGDVISSALSNLYYPKSDRGGGLVVENVLTSTAERTVSTVMQEFVLHKFTFGPKGEN